MESTTQAPTLDLCTARIVRDGDRMFFDLFTSDGEALLNQMADKRNTVCITPTSFPQSTIRPIKDSHGRPN